MIRRAGSLCLLLALLLPLPEARACSIPVFRYALEQWEPSPYTLLVFHRGPLPAAADRALESLEAPGVPVNVRVRRIDLADNVPAAAAKLWQRHGDPRRLPWVVVTAPYAEPDAPPTYAGPLDAAELRRLVDSPFRRQLARLLTGGESAVWVLLESGDRGADDAAWAMLRRELPRLQAAIRLPEPTDDDESRLVAALPLRLSFTALRLSRQDAAERPLVQLLLQSDDGLDAAKGPIVFPIFGRGRVLLGLHGDELTAARLDYWASFLCGPCSCRVKELNPGTDLLFTTDWDDLLGTAGRPRQAERPTLAAPPIPPGVSAVEQPQERPRWWLWGGLGGCGALAALGGAWLLRRAGQAAG